MNTKLHFWVLNLTGLLLHLLLQPSAASIKAPAIAATQQHLHQASELAEAIDQWKSQLEAQPDFNTWKDAAYSIHPLGPGTHGWIILVEAKQGVIGYMIVYANEQGGFYLAEYGHGDRYSFQMLYDHIDQLKYYGPFHSIIVTKGDDNSICYIDPFLQESLPLSDQLLKQQEQQSMEIEAGHGTAKQPALITGSIKLSYFAPYHQMPWLTGESLNYAFEDDTSVETLIELGSNLRFTTESWNDTIFSAFSITGFHEWNEYELFLALQGEDEQLTRYIAYDILMQLGHFYKPTNY